MSRKKINLLVEDFGILLLRKRSLSAAVGLAKCQEMRYYWPVIS